jgi:hypothetical protein
LAAAEAQLQKLAGSVEVIATWSNLRLSGSEPLRDLWRQSEMGASDGTVSAKVAFHGALMLRIGTPRGSR